MKKKTIPVFLGLSHIGQVYSLSWVKRIGKCSVFDFNKKDLENFKKKKYTLEESSLAKINFNKNNLIILENETRLSESKIIFFTYDTPINKNAIPNLKYIEKYLKKLFTIKFKHNVNIIVTSQTYPGYLEYVKKKYIKNNKKIELIYMVDTLKMGESVERFINPDQLIFGCDKKNKKTILNLFQDFKCKKFFFSIKEAELIKVSINLYLYFSVNFANILENFASEMGTSFSKVVKSLRTDKRIGKYAYINPSMGISGGHLERDAFYIKKLTKNCNIKKLFDNFGDFNSEMKRKLKSTILFYTKKKFKKILIIGYSYKKKSFSLVGNIFRSILNDKRFKVNIYDSFYPNINSNINQIYDLKKGISQADTVVYNYGKLDDLKIIKKEFAKENKKYLINISPENKEFLKDKKNVINIFSKEVSEFS